MITRLERETPPPGPRCWGRGASLKTLVPFCLIEASAGAQSPRRVCGLRVSETKGLKIPISCPSCCRFEPGACGARRHSRATRCKKKKNKRHGIQLLVSGSHITTHTHSPHFASGSPTLGGLCHLLNSSQVWESVCVCV